MEVLRSLEVVEGIVGRRRCARAKLAVQLRERYRRLITREMVAFNFAPRNSTQAGSVMKTGQGGMDWFWFAEESTSLREGSC